MELLNDNALLQQLQDDSEDAFSKIYHKYWRKIYMQAYDRLKDVKQSQDITQDIFISLWERRKVLDIQNLNAYLSSAVRYSVLKLVAADKVKVDFYTLAEALVPRSSSADDRLITDELIEAFNNLVENMPEQRRKIFRMRYQSELKTKVIAEQLNITQKTVQNQLLSSYKDIRFLLANLLSLAATIIIWFHSR